MIYVMYNFWTSFCNEFGVPFTVDLKKKHMSEWLLFNANSAFFQLYHGENKLIVQWNDDDEVRFVLDQHAELDFYSASSLKQ